MQYPDETSLAQHDERALQQAHEILGALVQGPNFRNFAPLVSARDLIGNVLASMEDN